MLAKLQPNKKQLRIQRLKTVALWTGVGLLSYELFMALVVRRQRRRDAFNAAVTQANATQKQLVVIGDPDGSWTASFLGRDYDCGELCIDERGCPRCKTQAIAPVAQVLHTLPDNSAVIFVAGGALERSPELPNLLAELQRVSGGDFYVAHVEPYTLAAVWPTNKQRILQAPPQGDVVTWKPLPWGKGVAGSVKVLHNTGGKKNSLPMGA
jgi:hypothetical protein